MPAYDLKCTECGAMTEVVVPMMQAPADGRCCKCGGYARRSFHLPQICTLVAHEKFLGGKFWNGCNTAEKVQMLKDQEAAYEKSWEPSDNSDIRVERDLDAV